MRYAIAIPQVVADGTFDSGRLRRFLARAEAVGFDSAWTQEQVLGAMPTLAPLETMAFASACTVVVMSLRDHVGEWTALSVEQGTFATEDRRALHEQGWTESLDRLEELLKSRDWATPDGMQ